MCPYLSQHYGIPHWKFVLRCCEKYPGIIIPHQEKNIDAKKRYSTIHVRVDRNLLRCTVHGLCLYEEQTTCSMCSADISSVTTGKLYIQKEIVLLEPLISEFHDNYYIP